MSDKKEIEQLKKDIEKLKREVENHSHSDDEIEYLGWGQAWL